MKQSQEKAIIPARQLHRANGIPTCRSGARGSSAFVGGFELADVVSAVAIADNELVDVVSVVPIADKGGGDDGRTEADPGVNKIVANAVKMRRRRESWECILGDINWRGLEKG